eukprot:8259204-Pyramimonas_sp.AAC.1
MFPSAKLRSRIHALTARFCAWCGERLRIVIYPSRGFYGEELPSTSWRAKVAGAKIAGGFTFFYAGFKADLECRHEANGFKNEHGRTY